MKHILLTNDDGFDAIGLKALIEALTPIAKISVVAPAKNKSACGLFNFRKTIKNGLC